MEKESIMKGLVISKILHKIYNILLGSYRNIFKIRPNFFKNRYDICKDCELKKRVKGFGEYCDECGCIIKSKISVKSEQCPL